MIFFSIKITSVFCGCGNLSHRLSYYLRDYRNYTTLSAISQSITLSEAAARAYNDDEYLREKANGFIRFFERLLRLLRFLPRALSASAALSLSAVLSAVLSAAEVLPSAEAAKAVLCRAVQTATISIRGLSRLSAAEAVPEKARPVLRFSVRLLSVPLPVRRAAGVSARVSARASALRAGRLRLPVRAPRGLPRVLFQIQGRQTVKSPLT